VVATTQRLVAQGSPFLVLGETGTGKASLVQESFRAAGTELVVINCALPPWSGPDSVSSVLDEHRSNGSPVLIRGLELVHGGLARSLAAVLASWRDTPGAPLVVGTWTTVTGEISDPDQQSLLDVMSVGRVEIPPLRDRSEDIIATSQAILRGLGRPTLRISAGAMRALTRAPWPGNVRQLETVLRGAVATARDEIRAEQLPPEIQASATRRDLTVLERLELKAILDALQQAGGNKVTAAKLVGIGRSTLYRKLRSYRIDPDSEYY
jgi:transcriptional regulator of acetoin/glycerol metabolism